MKGPYPSRLDLSSEAARRRAEADGEAPHADTSDPRIAFERELRERVARAMSGSAAPAELRAKVHALLHEAPAHAHGGGTHTDRVHRRWRWRAAAGVAALVVIGGAVALVLPSRGPAHPSSGGAAAPLVQSPAASERLTRLISFTSAQHDQCAMLGEAFNAKMKARTETEAQKIAIELLAKVPDVLDLRCAALAKAGYRFAGLGPCAVPGTGRSAHLIYKPDPAIAPDGPIVSLFVQEDAGDLPLEFDCALTNRACDANPIDTCACCVTMWRKEGLVYYLVAPPLPPDVRRAFDAPEREKSIL
jgi:hypothetical protein